MSAVLFVSLSTSSAPLASAGSDCNWTMYGGNPQRTSVAPSSCIPTFENGFETKWLFDSSMYHLFSEYSAPIVVDNKVFIGTRDKMYCIDAENGEKIWSFKTGGGIESTPTYYENSIIFGSIDEYVYRLDANTGDEIWSYKTKHFVYSSLLVANDKVFGHDGIYNGFCLDAKTGKELWTGGDGGASSPACSGDGNYIYFGQDSYRGDNFICVNAKSGKTVWSFETKDEVKSSPAVSNDKVVFGCEDGNIYCVDASRGSLKWKYRTGEAVSASPCIYSNKVYIGSKEGYFLCLDLNNGRELWRFESDDTEYSSATACGNIVCFGGNNSFFYVLNANTGEEIWIGKTKSRTAFLGQPAICNNMIFTSYSEGIQCLAPKAPKKVERIEIYPLYKEIEIGESYTFEVTLYDDENNVMDGVVKWEVGDLGLLGIDNDGKVTGKKAGETSIKASVGDVYSTAQVYINDGAAVSEIEISPDDATLKVGETLQFNAKALNWRGKMLDSADISWSVNPSKYGYISDDGLFEALEAGVCTVRAFVGEVNSTVNVKIIPNLKPAIIESDTEEIDFGEVPQDTKKTRVFVLTNSGEQSASINIQTNNDWLNVGTDRIDLEPGDSKEIIISLNAAKMKLGTADGIIYVSWGFGNDFSIEISAEVIEACSLGVVPESLFFGKIARGKEMTLPFMITVPNGVHGTISSSNPWIEVSPSSFSGDDTEVSGYVKIKASALPYGDDFSGYVDFVPNTDSCKGAKLDVIVKTDKSIHLELSIGSSQAALNNEAIDLDVPPQIIEGRTLVPVRFISESFGCVVGWEASTGKITITRGNFRIELFKDKKAAYIDGKEYQLDVPAKIVSGRTLVPVRFISEGFGAEVIWIAETKTIVVDWKPF